MFRKVCFCLFILSFGITACDAGKTPSSSLQINFQAKGVSGYALNANEIENIIVNVSGPGIDKTIFAKRDCHEPGMICDKLHIPNIPTGKRLVQLLVVTKAKDDGSNEGTLFYGHIDGADITGDTQLPIMISEIGNFNQEAEFSGQYIPKSTHPLDSKRLTGQISVETVVAPDKPNMIIGRSEIFAGWFRLFLINSVKFKYVFTGRDGTGNFHHEKEIFNDIHQGAGFSLEGVVPFGRRVVHFSSDEQVREERDGVYKMRNFRSQVVAFLGQSEHRACYGASGFKYDGTSGSDDICKANEPSCAVANQLDFDNDINIPAINLAAGVNSCVGVINKWNLNVKRINDPGKFTGFHGPFTNGGNPANKIIDVTGGSTLSWNIHPWTQLSGFDVFTKIDANFDSSSIETHDIGHGYKCNQLVANYGFNPPKPAQHNGGTQFSYTLTTQEMGHLAANSLNVVICAKSMSGLYFKTALHFGSQHTQTSNPVLSKVGLRKIVSTQNYINRHACVPLMVELLDQGGQLIHSPTGVNVDLDTNFATSNFYKLPNCSVIISSPIEVHDQKVVYFKTGATVSSTGYIEADDNNGVLTRTRITSLPVAGNLGDHFKIVGDYYRPNFEIATTEACSPVKGLFIDSNGAPAKSSSSGTIHIQATKNGANQGNRFSSVDDCASAVSSFGVSSGVYFKQLYVYNPSLTYAHGDEIDTVTVTCSSHTCETSHIDVVDPGPFSHVRLDLMSVNYPNYNQGDCMHVKVGAYDNKGYPVNFPDTNNINLSASTGEFYSEGSFCVSPISTAGTMAPFAAQTNASEFIYEFSTPTTGPLNLNMIYNNFNPQVNVTISPP